VSEQVLRPRLGLHVAISLCSPCTWGTCAKRSWLPRDGNEAPRPRAGRLIVVDQQLRDAQRGYSNRRMSSRASTQAIQLSSPHAAPPAPVQGNSVGGGGTGLYKIDRRRSPARWIGSRFMRRLRLPDSPHVYSGSAAYPATTSVIRVYRPMSLPKPSTIGPSLITFVCIQVATP